MDRDSECIASIRKNGMYGKCRNGFPQTGACWMPGGLPICMNEALCGFLYPKTGKPEQQGNRRDRL